MQDDYNIKICESGANKNKAFIFNKIRDNKKFQKAVTCFALLGAAYLAPMTAEAKETKAQIEYTYSDMYKSEVSNTPDPKLGAYHPRIAKNLPDNYITNKISNVEGETYVVRYDVSENGNEKDAEIIATAQPHTLAFLNPYTTELEKMNVLIETGHSTEELNFLKRLLRTSLKTKIGYDLITNKKNQLSGEMIFSSKAMRGDGGYLGYNHTINGIIFVGQTENESDGFNTMIHELDHIGHNLIKSTQIREASARTISFFAEVEAKKKNSNYEFSKAGKRLLPIYEKYSKENLPNDKMLAVVFLTSFIAESGLFDGYNEHMGQFKKTWLDLSKIGIVPKSLRQEGRPTNYLHKLDEKDFANAFAASKELSVKERYQILSGKEIDRNLDIVINYYDDKQKKNIPINVVKAPNPKKSGFLQLSQKLSNDAKQAKTEMNMVAAISAGVGKNVG